MRLAFAMRTADRSPKANYLRTTLDGFQTSGGDLAMLHLCPTDPDLRWLTAELEGLPEIIVDVPPRRRGANENGLAAIEWAASRGDMVVLLEDDLAFCADFVGSLSRWLDRYARHDRHVYKCFGFTKPPLGNPAAYDVSLDSLRASQVIVLWADEARAFVRWGHEHLHDWPTLVPWAPRWPKVKDPAIGFDKFVATWALTTWPGVPGVMTYPCFVDHIGAESSLHSYGLMDSRQFAGPAWTYQEAS